MTPPPSTESIIAAIWRVHTNAHRLPDGDTEGKLVMLKSQLAAAAGLIRWCADHRDVIAEAVKIVKERGQ